MNSDKTEVLAWWLWSFSTLLTCSILFYFVELQRYLFDTSKAFESSGLLPYYMGYFHITYIIFRNVENFCFGSCFAIKASSSWFCCP
jgi:hypothetical protein